MTILPLYRRYMACSCRPTVRVRNPRWAISFNFWRTLRYVNSCYYQPLSSVQKEVNLEILPQNEISFYQHRRYCWRNIDSKCYLPLTTLQILMWKTTVCFAEFLMVECCSSTTWSHTEGNRQQDTNDICLRCPLSA
jgi:hypothetical protein